MIKFLISLLLLIEVLNSSTLIVGDDESYRVLSYYEYSAVKDMNETVDSLDNHIWYKDSADVVLNRDHKGYWIRFKIKNSVSHKENFYLMAERDYVYSIEYYLLRSGQIVAFDKEGFHTQQENPPFNSTHRIFSLPMERGAEYEIFFKVQNYNMVNLPFRLVTEKYIVDFYQSYNFFQGIFFGVILLMLIYNFILYMIGRFKPYLYNFSYFSFMPI